MIRLQHYGGNLYESYMIKEHNNSIVNLCSSWPSNCVRRDFTVGRVSLFFWSSCFAKWTDCCLNWSICIGLPYRGCCWLAWDDMPLLTTSTFAWAVGNYCAIVLPKICALFIQKIQIDFTLHYIVFPFTIITVVCRKNVRRFAFTDPFFAVCLIILLVNQ